MSDMDIVKELGKVDCRNGDVEKAPPPQHSTARSATMVAVNSSNKEYDSNIALY